MKSFLVDQDGYYGEFGGAYVPEILHKCVEELTNKYLEVIESEEFKKELPCKNKYPPLVYRRRQHFRRIIPPASFPVL